METADHAITQQIESLVLEFVQALAEGRLLPLQTLPRNETAYVEEEHGLVPTDATLTRSLSMRSAVGTAMQYMRMWKVLDVVHQLLRTAKQATLRDVYYMLISDFSDQSELNDIVRDVAAMLHRPRHELHIVAMSRGVWGGDLELRFGEQGQWLRGVEAPAGGLPIPGDVMARPPALRSTARYVLVIEKDGIFERLAEDRFFEIVPCILVTAKGFPDLATRALVRQLADTLQIPVLGLVDFNPFGLAILLTYRLGSAATVVESAAYTVDIRWLGLRSDDLAALQLPAACRQALTPRDRVTAERLLATRYVRERPAYAAELRFMLEHDCKVELQALHTRGYDTLARRYLPARMLQHAYI